MAAGDALDLFDQGLRRDHLCQADHFGSRLRTLHGRLAWLAVEAVSGAGQEARLNVQPLNAFSRATLLPRSPRSSPPAPTAALALSTSALAAACRLPRASRPRSRRPSPCTDNAHR